MAPKGGLNFRKKVSLFYGKAMGVALLGKKLPGKPLLFDLAPKSNAKTKWKHSFLPHYFFSFLCGRESAGRKWKHYLLLGEKGKGGDLIKKSPPSFFSSPLFPFHHFREAFPTLISPPPQIKKKEMFYSRRVRPTRGGLTGEKAEKGGRKKRAPLFQGKIFANTLFDTQ